MKWKYRINKSQRPEFIIYTNDDTQLTEIKLYTLAHCIWLQPSFFWMGDLQLAHGLELVNNHRQLAASS